MDSQKKERSSGQCNHPKCRENKRLTEPGPALIPTPREGLPRKRCQTDCRDQGQAPPTQGSLKEAERRIQGWFPSIPASPSLQENGWVGGPSVGVSLLSHLSSGQLSRF